MGAQKLQPLQALLLVRPQFGQQAWGRGNFGQGTAACQLLQHVAQAVGPLPVRALAEGRAHAQRLQARQPHGVAVEMTAARTPFTHQVQQGLQPGPKRFRRQAQEVAGLLLQVNVGRQLERGRSRIGGSWVRCLAMADCAELRQQLGQQRQDVMALAIDVHAQGQVEPGRTDVVVAGQILASRVATLRCQLHLEPIGARDPAGQAGIHGQHEASVA